jgi:hypothetical protein
VLGVTELIVPRRFCGPPDSGNGGWTAGTLATTLACEPGDHTDGWPAIEVSLRQPPPLDVALHVVVDGDSSTASHGDVVVATARCAPDVVVADVEAVPPAVARAAEAAYAGHAFHPFPTCFSCGTGRAHGDGLRLQPGRVEGTDTYACTWVPADDVDVETVWAALDCPGGWASGIAGRPMVLGTMTARVDALPAPGAPHVVMAWQRGEEGRKHLSGTALYAADGTVLAQAEATWIAVDPTTVRPAGGTA